MNFVNTGKIHLYRYSLKAIACIVGAFDIVRSNLTLEKDCETFLRQWVIFFNIDPIPYK
jgi:hypothetical protein